MPMYRGLKAREVLLKQVLNTSRFLGRLLLLTLPAGVRVNRTFLFFVFALSGKTFHLIIFRGLFSQKREVLGTCFHNTSRAFSPFCIGISDL
jgi:hypothetical protein